MLFYITIKVDDEMTRDFILVAKDRVEADQMVWELFPEIDDPFSIFITENVESTIFENHNSVAELVTV